MRVHARSRRPKFRDYRLVSTVGIGAAGLEIPVDTLELVGHERWRGGLRVQIGEQRAVKLLRDGLADVPLTVVAALPVDRSLHLEVRAIELSTDVLTLSGAVEVK